jgi:proteasome lid subunit RPN8/RPN11
MARRKNKHKQGTTSVAEATHSVAISGSVLQNIRLHARSEPQREICGVLLGSPNGSHTRVVAAIKGQGANQGDAHVTFTQETWNTIHQEKDAKYPDEKIVGWYHSHPGFGVFLSDHDLFIHKNFFSQPGQLAWVFDPHKRDVSGGSTTRSAASNGSKSYRTSSTNRSTAPSRRSSRSRKTAPRSTPSRHRSSASSPAIFF